MRAIAFTLALGWISVCGYAKEDKILLNDGTEISGTIVGVDDDGIKVKTGENEQFIEFQELDAHAFYLLIRNKIPNTAEARLKLAVYAFENGLFNQARHQYRLACSLAPEKVKDFEDNVLPKIKEKIAANLLEAAKRAYRARDFRHAQRATSKILTALSDTKAAAEARELIASIHFGELEADEAKRAKAFARHVQQDVKAAEAKRERVIAPIEKRIARGQERVTRGLRKTNLTQARNDYKAAANDFESALAEIERQRKALEKQRDAMLEEQLALLEEAAKREGVDAYINMGNIYLTRRAYKDALQAGNKALSIDRGNAYAHQFLARVQSESQIRQGFRRGR